MWRLLTAIIAAKTSARIVFLGNNKKQWRDEISKVLPLDKFPKRYGGDGDDDQVVINIYGSYYIYFVHTSGEYITLKVFFHNLL
jgi:hypothetical protein